MSEIEPVNTYELPAGYGDNRVVLMIKDPHWIFAYWDIDPAVSDLFRSDFGNDIWDRSAPFLKIRNITKNEESYIRINEFSKSWYISVPELDCLYTVEVGRKVGERFFVCLAESNVIATPRNSVSSNTETFFINYKKPEQGFMKNYGACPDGTDLSCFPINGPSSVERCSSDLFGALASSGELQEISNR